MLVAIKVQHKPEAPQSPQISGCCVRDLVRDILLNNLPSLFAKHIHFVLNYATVYTRARGRRIYKVLQTTFGKFTEKIHTKLIALVECSKRSAIVNFLFCDFHTETECACNKKCIIFSVAIFIYF